MVIPSQSLRQLGHASSSLSRLQDGSPLFLDCLFGLNGKISCFLQIFFFKCFLSVCELQHVIGVIFVLDKGIFKASYFQDRPKKCFNQYHIVTAFKKSFM